MMRPCIYMLFDMFNFLGFFSIVAISERKTLIGNIAVYGWTLIKDKERGNNEDYGRV